MNENISLQYTQKAKKYFVAGDFEKASFYISKAGEFSKEYSDYWYTAGLVARLNNDMDQAVINQKKGLEIDLWLEETRDKGLIALSQDLFRTGRYKEQIKLYEDCYPIYKNNEEFYLITVRSLYFDGFYDKAKEWAEKGIRMFPNRIEFLFILKKADDDPLITDQIFYKADYYKIDIEEGIRNYLSGFSPKDKFRWIAYYKQHYGETPFYLLLTGDINQDSSENFYGDLLLIKKVSQLKYSPFKDGEYYIDSNYDGYREELIIIRNGKPVQWFIDKDQNGIDELIVEFGSDGLPLRIENNNLTLEYSPYPYVKTAVVNGEEERKRTYRYIHKIFSIDLLPDYSGVQKEFVFKGELLNWNTVALKESQLFSNAGILEKSVDNIVTDRYTIVDGSASLILYDNDKNGIFDEEVVLNKEGFIRSGRRDIDEDGVYDIYDHYERGVWDGFSFDSDGDNVPEFYRDWSLIDTKIWDNDGDGYIDSKYITDGKGRKLSEGFLYRDKLSKIDFLSWDFRNSRHQLQ